MGNMESVGEYLKRERQSKGVTVDEICDTTRITKRFIMAMEENNFDLMPGDTLIVGFLRNYAKAIGIDADEVVGKYYAQVKSKESPARENEVVDKTKGLDRRNVILGAVVFIFLVGAYFFSDGRSEQKRIIDKGAVEESLSSVYEGEEEDAEVSLAPAAVTAPPLPAEKTVAKKEVEKPAVKEEAKKTPAKKEEVITIKANESAWVNIVIDGNEVKDVLLQAREEITYKGKESFLFTTGNLQAIEVRHNGQLLSFEGSKKSVIKNYLIKSSASDSQ